MFDLSSVPARNNRSETPSFLKIVSKSNNYEINQNPGPKFRLFLLILAIGSIFLVFRIVLGQKDKMSPVCSAI
jgi:hypothetical protein